MTYIELINHFWQLFENKGMKPNDALLYFYLLKECNRKSWQNPFSLSNKSVVIALEISEKSIIDSRRRLIERNLIKVKRGDRNCSAPEYFIIGVDDENFNLPTESRTVDEMSMNGRRTVTFIKDLKTIRPKNKSPIPPDKPGEGVLDLGLDEPKKKKTKPRTPQESPPAPTREDVKVYFLSQSADIRLDDWEAEAEIFFNNFDATDWVDASGRKIKRWDSRANRWILEKEQRKKSHHVTTSTTRPDTATDERQQRQVDIASYVAHNIGSNANHPGSSGTDMPI